MLLAGEWAKCLQEIIAAITESSIYADVIFILGTQTQLTPVCVSLFVCVCVHVTRCADVHFEVHCVVLWQKRVCGFYEGCITGQRAGRNSSHRLLPNIIHCVLVCVGVWMERCQRDTLHLWNIVNTVFFCV